MKYRTTRKALVAGADNLRCAGYCELQTLLYNHDATAYTAGVYGWNFNVYEVYGLTICTGYRGMPGQRLQSSNEYESKAKAIINNYDMAYEEKKAKVEALLKEFCIKNGGRE